VIQQILHHANEWKAHADKHGVDELFNADVLENFIDIRSRSFLEVVEVFRALGRREIVDELFQERGVPAIDLKATVINKKIPRVTGVIEKLRHLRPPGIELIGPSYWFYSGPD
jgi:hypothetical protein